jgi:hypothetical protein
MDLSFDSLHSRGKGGLVRCKVARTTPLHNSMFCHWLGESVRGLVVMIAACQVMDPGSSGHAEKQGIDPCASCMQSMRSTI